MLDFKSYKKLIYNNCTNGQNNESKTVLFWQNQLFASVITYIIPLSFVSIIPGVTFCIMHELYALCFFDLSAFILLLVIGFSKNISAELRKILFIFCCYYTGLFLLMYIGVKGPGLLFFYASTVFGLLILPAKYAWKWSWVNIFICIFFAFALHFNLSTFNEVNNTTVGEWFAVCSNLIFLSLVSSALIPQLFLGLSTTLQEQEALQKSLTIKTLEQEKTLQEVNQKNADLEQFAHVTSHDLQEPLRMIISFLTLLEKKYGNQLDDKANQYIHFAVSGASRMRQIILDLMDYSKISTTNNNKETFNIREIIDDFIIINQKQINANNITIIVHDMPSITNNKEYITKAFHHLLSNAIKYIRPNTKPTIKIKATDQITHWQFEIEDNGIGIESVYFEKIFIIFQRLHNYNEFEGTGIGLALVKKVLTNLGGEIWLQSKPNEGTTFYFTIKK